MRSLKGPPPFLERQKGYYYYFFKKPVYIELYLFTGKLT